MDFYHVLNRGINKADVFLDNGDRMRFVRGMYNYNDVSPAPNSISQKSKWLDDSRQRTELVYIHAWCLMSNHYHLLLSPADDNPANISSFMRKLNMGYAKFFNEKYERSGYLWQGKYKKIEIQRNSQFMYIPYYIHLNPLDFSYKEWREGKVSRSTEAVSFLVSYRWSSWLDYTGKRNFPSVIYKDVLSDTLGNKNFQLNEINKIITNYELAIESSFIET